MYQTHILQNLTELSELCDIIRKENVASYLEIGSKYGGSLWHIATALPPGAKMVAVDLPHGDKSPYITEPHLRACVDHLQRKGFDAHLFLGDSTDPAIVEQVRAFAPFDLCFIDANHTLPYIEKDWANYGPMARVIAFHDVGWKRGTKKGKKPIEVPTFWNRIKTEYRHLEICREADYNGIGVIWT